MSDILEHLAGFEKNQNELGDRYGAEILHNAAKEISRLSCEGELKNAVIEAAEAFQNSRFDVADYSKESLALDEALAALVSEGQKFTENVKKCIGNDPLCPCQDGDMCHYEGPDPWPIPTQ